MKIFISGGCKNGKSTIAEGYAVKMAGERPLYYMATMIPHDEEDRERIRNHVKARDGKGFTTVECGTGLTIALKEMEAQGTDIRRGVYLVDAVTALLANDYAHPENVQSDLKAFCEAVPDAVFVSDFIYSAEEGYSEVTEVYRKGLADCDRMLAGKCDAVIEICAAQQIIYKGGELL